MKRYRLLFSIVLILSGIFTLYRYKSRAAFKHRNRQGAVINKAFPEPKNSSGQAIDRYILKAGDTIEYPQGIPFSSPLSILDFQGHENKQNYNKQGYTLPNPSCIYKENGGIEYHRGRIIVKLSEEAAEKLEKGEPLDVPGKIIRRISKKGLYEFAPEEGESVENFLERINKDFSDLVKYAQLDYECTLQAISLQMAYKGDRQDVKKYMWHMDSLNIDKAHEITKGSQSIIIALLDSGIAYENHKAAIGERPNILKPRYCIAPGLKNANIWENTGEIPDNMKDDDNNGYVDDRDGFDFINRDGHPNDDNGHGTHLASLISQKYYDNRIFFRVNRYRLRDIFTQDSTTSIAPDSTLMNLKVIDNRGKGYASIVSEAIYYAVEHGARVINMSLAWPPGLNPGQIVQDAITHAADSGVIIIAGSGNNSRDILCYPSAYENVISIGASGINMMRAPYSNFGYGLELMAPGGNILTDLNNDGYADGIIQETFSKRYLGSIDGEALANPLKFSYIFIQGTSIATAQASAVVGLILSLEPTLNLGDIRAILHSTATDMGAEGWDINTGYGLINAAAALKCVSSGICNKSVNPAGSPLNIGIAGKIDLPYDEIDADKDGYAAFSDGGNDCDDADPMIYPSAEEIANDGIDQDCNGYDLIVYFGTEPGSYIKNSNNCLDEDECEEECDECEEFECNSCSGDEDTDSEECP